MLEWDWDLVRLRMTLNVIIFCWAKRRRQAVVLVVDAHEKKKDGWEIIMESMTLAFTAQKCWPQTKRGNKGEGLSATCGLWCPTLTKSKQQHKEANPQHEDAKLQTKLISNTIKDKEEWATKASEVNRTNTRKLQGLNDDNNARGNTSNNGDVRVNSYCVWRAQWAANEMKAQQFLGWLW